MAKTTTMATNSKSKRRSGGGAATVARDLQEIGAATRQMADHGVAAVRETARQYFDEGRARLRYLGDDVQSRIIEQPAKSLLIAAGIGFLLGAIWTRR